MIDPILKYTYWNIKILIIDDFGHHREKYENNPRIEKILTLSDLMNYEGEVSADFEEINSLGQLYPIGDYGSRRIKDDIYFSQYQFYNAYGFWNTFFRNEKIDICLIFNTLHGFANDYMLEAVASKKGIRTYNINYDIEGKYGLYSSNRRELVRNTTSKGNMSLDQIANYISVFDYDKGVEELPYGKFLKVLYNIGGSYAVRMASFLYRGSYPIHYHDSSFGSYIKTLKRVKKTKKHVNKLYYQPNYNEKFFAFFLHFEPEAAITGNSPNIYSQIFLIRLLSQALPQGYKLYVKEHPDVYRLKKWGIEYHVPCMNTFYTSYFYDQISHISNVRLIDHRVKSSEIMPHAMAVASISGTVLSEAMVLKKPIIMFSNNRHIYTMDGNVLNPKGSVEIQEIVDKIITGFEPDYSGIQQLIDSYLFDITEDGEEALIRAIEKDGQ